MEPNLGPIQSWIDLCIAIGSLAAFLVGWVKVIRPKIQDKFHRVRSNWHAFVGRDPIIDSVSREVIRPALPGLGGWMTGQSAETAENTRQIAELTQTIATLAKVVEHQSRLDGISEDHEKRITALEAARVEQALARKESTAAFRAIEAAAKGGADITAEDVISDPEIGE